MPAGMGMGDMQEQFLNAWVVEMEFDRWPQKAKEVELINSG